MSDFKELLEEAYGWLCSHSDAYTNLREPYDGTYRLWCSDCHNYLRSMEDSTLHKRIGEALKMGTEA